MNEDKYRIVEYMNGTFQAQWWVERPGKNKLNAKMRDILKYWSDIGMRRATKELAQEDIDKSKEFWRQRELERTPAKIHESN